MKLRIAFCKTSFFGPVSGADEVILTYAVNLHDAGHDVSVVLLYPPAADDPYLRRLRLNGVPVNVIVPRSLLFALLVTVRNLLSTVLFFLFLINRAPEDLRKFWQIAINLISRLHYRDGRKYLARTRPDLLHIVTPDSGATMMIRAGHELGISVLYHEMGTPHHLPLLNGHYRRLEKVLPFCTEVAALSPRLAADWLTRFPFLDSISVLPLIMEPYNTFNLAPESHLKPTQTVFGFAARVEEGKGPLLLVDALARLIDDQPQIIARIAGVGPQLPHVKARVRELALGDLCEFVGHYSEPMGRTAFMNSLDVLVLPSFAEGTPNSIVEAMAHGVPVIASNVGGIPDMIDAASGIIVPPGDAEALANAMMALAKDRQRRTAMGVAARERYQQLFAPKAVMPMMLQLYQRVVANGHSTAVIQSENGKRHPWSE